MPMKTLRSLIERCRVGGSSSHPQGEGRASCSRGMDAEEERSEIDIHREFSEVCRLYDENFGRGAGAPSTGQKRNVQTRAEILAAVAQTEAAQEQVKATKGLKRATWALFGATVLLALAAVAEIAAVSSAS